MNPEFRIRFFAILLALSLLTPMGIGVVHALHEHDRFICQATDENHIHSKGFDCEHEHYFHQDGYIANLFYEETPVSHNFSRKPIQEEGIEKDSELTQNQLRGPPGINV